MPASAPLVDADGLDQAQRKLAAASKAAADAQAAVDEVASRVPAAQTALDTAEVAYLQFDAEARKAAAELLAAKGRVLDQERAVAQAEANLARLRDQMDEVARSSYINGGENAELAVLLGLEDPADVVGAAEAQERTSRGKVNVLAQLTAAKAALTGELVQLQDVEQAATQRQQASREAAAQAQVGRDAARESREALERLVAERTQALAAAQASQADLQALYDQLMAEKAAAEAAAAAARAQAAAEKAAAEKAAAEKAAAETAAVAQQGSAAVAAPVAGTGTASNTASRTGQAAVDFAMGFVGGGEEFRGLCLTFVDNAYAPTGGRVGTAIEQWERANANGHGHPGDRNPPIGAQVFWQTSDPARHAAIYAGGGMVITTEAYNGRVGLASMEAVDSWGPYLGWATPYYG
jgi:septal ring factor EnvC (AmiA/AmiB activator)